jgi:methionyl aminopeptidase
MLMQRLHRPTAAVPIWSGKALEGIRAACRVGREVLDKAHAAVRPGVTTDEIDRIVHEATVEAGGYPSPLNYYNFPKSVCTSVNEVRGRLQWGAVLAVSIH